MTDEIELLAQEQMDEESSTSGRLVNGTIVERNGAVVIVDIGGQTVPAYSQPTAGLVVGNTVQLARQEGTATVVQVIDGPAGGVPVGALMMWPTTTPPAGWLLCNGATFSATDYPVLASAAVLNGTTLPDFRDRFPIGVSSSKTVKSTGGNASITQTVAQMPSHNHNISVDNTTLLYPNTGNVASIIYPVVNGAVTTFTGGGQPMNILNPYFAVNFIIYAGAVAA